mmetsp:Transcript_21673/g.31541  ORF Transcript_21673/g.31541 Transcript_21673/m.31541 type:complete len:224 (-) Transcript_21673:87-758(-)
MTSVLFRLFGCRCESGGGMSDMLSELSVLLSSASDSISSRPELELEGVPDAVWTPATHRLFSYSFRRKVFTLLCCLKRCGIFLPHEVLTLLILSHFTLRSEIMSHVVCISATRTEFAQLSRYSRIYSLHSPVALDIVSCRDDDGEVRIVFGERCYPNSTDSHLMLANLHSSEFVYWKRLRDGSDFSWRVTKMTEDMLSHTNLLIFGTESIMDNESWFYILKQL